MKSKRSFVLEFYAPILLFLFILGLIITSPKFKLPDKALNIDAQVSVLAINIPLPVWLGKIWLVRALLLFAAVASLVRGLTVDFSKYFPAKLNMDVYFDERGIERSLRTFSTNDCSEVSLAANWREHIQLYDEAVKSSLRDLWRQRPQREVPNIDDFSRELIHARGSTNFLVTRLQSFCYRVN
jgi:hypothetical protein